MPDQPGIDVDWDNWTAKMRSMLVFIKRDDEVLLIRKKRGLGEGKINGPGGKVDEGETVEEAGIRETQEEVGLTPKDLQHHGELYFQFADGLSIHCTVFVTETFEGELTETDEAEPMWVKIADVPYDEMWEDDQFWLPQVLAGETFVGRFTFDEDKMLSKDLQFGSDTESPEEAPPEKEEPAHTLDEATFKHLQLIVESLIMASESPMSETALLATIHKVASDQEAMADEAQKAGEPFEGPDVNWVKDLKESAILAAIDALNLSYGEQDRAFAIAERAAGFKIYTRPNYGMWVRGLFPDQKPQRLRPPALETLAIIAYRQPMTKADIEAVRGVSVDGVLKMLLDRNLVHIGGRAEVPGRPLLYETTEIFLDHFGIRSVDDLPNAEELRAVKLPTAEEEKSEEGEAPADEAKAEDSDKEEAQSEEAEVSEDESDASEEGDIPEEAETGESETEVSEDEDVSEEDAESSDDEEDDSEDEADEEDSPEGEEEDEFEDDSDEDEDPDNQS